MSDPFATGWVLGFSIGVGIATFEIARRALRKRGLHSLEDEHVGGDESASEASEDEDASEDENASEDEDASEEGPALHRAPRSWVPLLLAIGAASGTFVLATTVANHLRRTAAPAESLSASDLLLEVKAGFMRRCSSDCTAGDVPLESCRTGCLCTFDEFRRRHPDDEAFAAWIRSTDRAEIFKEVAVARDSCVQRLGEP